MSRGRLGVLAASGALLLALTGLALAVPRQDSPRGFLVVAAAQSAAYLAVVWSVWDGAASRRVVFAIAAVALAMRIAAVAGPPFLSSDIYRYIWDGRVIAAGINPYCCVPTDARLEFLRDPEIFPEINRANTAVTIYPPVAEAIFFAVTRIGESVTVMKAAMVGFEIATFALLLCLLGAAGLPAGRVAIYAWHPLPLWEFAGNGHIDAALIAFTAAALWAAFRRRQGLAGLFLAAATLTKLYPAVLGPALHRRREWRLPLVFTAAILLAYLPFLGVGWGVFGFLGGYAGEEGFDAGGGGFFLLSLLRHLPLLGGLSGRTYAVMAAGVLAILGARTAFGRDHDRSPVTAAAVLAAVFMVLLSPHYPWYFAWLIVFACLVPSLALLWLTNACLLLYLVPVGSQLVRDDYRLAIESLIYGPFAALALLDLWYCRRHAIRGS